MKTLVCRSQRIPTPVTKTLSIQAITLESTHFPPVASSMTRTWSIPVCLTRTCWTYKIALQLVTSRSPAIGVLLMGVADAYRKMLSMVLMRSCLDRARSRPEAHVKGRSVSENVCDEAIGLRSGSSLNGASEAVARTYLGVIHFA